MIPPISSAPVGPGLPRLAPGGPTRPGRRRWRAWTIAISLLLHGLLLALLLTLARRPDGKEGGAAPSYELVFDSPSTNVPKGLPDAAPPAGQPDAVPAPQPSPAPAPPRPKDDVPPGPESVPDAPPVADAPPTPPAPTPTPERTAPTERPAPTPTPVPVAPEAAVPPPPPVAAPAPTPAPPIEAPTVPEPQDMPLPSAPPQVRLEAPEAVVPAAPATPEFVPPAPPPPLPTPPAPRPRPVTPPRPRTAPQQTEAGTFANPLDLNFGAARPPTARLNAPRGSVASRSLDLTPGAPRAPNRADAFFDARAARLGADWQGALMAYWLAHRYYPKQAADDGQDGTVDLELTVGASGKVENAVIKSRSGNQFIDMAALGTWRNAKLLPLPPELGERYTFTITINYLLLR